LQQTQSELNQTQQTAQQAEATATKVEANSNLQVQKVQADLSDVKTAMNTTMATAQKTEKKVDELEHPNAIAYKGIRITPAGFVEMTEYFRSHATLSDQATPFNGIPIGAATNTQLTEYGMTARDSRLAVRLDTEVGTTKVAGYFEMDFFGTSPTANPNQTTSYTPRIRQGWARAKFANGWTITGGQMWNLITLNRKGTDADNSNLWIPNIIEAQYSVGYDWGRFAELRVSKQLNKNTSLAFAIANPSSLVFGANNTTAGIAGVASPGVGLYGNSLVSGCTATASSATPPVITVSCTMTPTYSTNLAPDVIAKLAYDDPKFGHYEVKALGRFFRDRVLPSGTATAPVAGWNNTAVGGGVGGGAVIPVVKKKVDFIAQGMWGKGISRYEDSGQYDFVLRSTDHNLQTVKSFSFLTGIETHPTPKAEIDVVFGDEYYYRSTYATSATAFGGYGSPTVANTGCYVEVASLIPAGQSTTCTGNNKNLWNAKIYGYYDLYKGSHGTLRYGAEYDYDYRATWSGNGGLPTGSKGLAPHGFDNTVFTTMRYIFP
jgi:hypothetical protein